MVIVCQFLHKPVTMNYYFHWPVSITGIYSAIWCCSLVWWTGSGLTYSSNSTNRGVSFVVAVPIVVVWLIVVVVVVVVVARKRRRWKWRWRLCPMTSLRWKLATTWNLRISRRCVSWRPESLRTRCGFCSTVALCTTTEVTINTWRLSKQIKCRQQSV